MALLDHMLLALPSPVKHPFEQRPVGHDHLLQRNLPAGPALLSTPPPEGGAATALTASRPSMSIMATPHRNLPPPAPLPLSDPGRIQTSASSQQQLPTASGMPAPPPQWPGMEEAMRNWLATKAEEEKRRQEEERTRQETLRLEQKKIEQNMLLEMMRSQVPFNLIPIIFLTLSNANASSFNSDSLQQSISQLVSQHISTMAPSADSQRERQNAYLTSQSVPPTPLEGSYGNLSTRIGPASGPPSAQRSHFPSGHPRTKAADMSAAPMSSQGSAHHPEQAPILFHHWQPPSSSNEFSTPPSQPMTSTSSDHVNSPKKRKAPGPHQPAPIPPSALRYSESTHARQSHSRHRSDASSRSLLHVNEEKPQSRPRADTAMNDDISPAEQQWQTHRFQSSPNIQSSRLQRPESSFGESNSFLNQDNASRRSSLPTSGPR